MVTTMTMLPRSHAQVPGEPGWTDPYAEQAAQTSADLAMAELGCRPDYCGVCGGRMYVLDGALGPFQCGQIDCSGQVGF